ncbi:MAG: rhodanese-like domain-containing protein, partial [Luteolibacter sp.]
ACDGSPTPEAKLDTMTRKVAKKFDEVRQLPTADLAAWLADPARKPPQLLDAREAAEFAVSHLSGAIRVDPDAGAEQVLAKIDKTRPLVVYCSVGYRSSALARRLIKAGHAQTMNLEGSIFKWANEGRPLVRDGKPALTVHPYDDNYGSMLREEFRAYR